MRIYGKIIEGATALYRLAFWTMLFATAIGGWLTYTSIKNSPMPHRTHWAVTHHYYPHWHIHWAGGKLLLYLVIIDVTALIVWRIAGGVVSHFVGYSYDLANVKSAGGYMGTPWTDRQSIRHANIYRRFK